MLSLVLNHHIRIHLIDDGNQASDSSKISEQSQNALMMFFIERCFGQYSSIISNVYSQLGDDYID